MSGVEFRGFPKIARLNRDITISEKIDGTNAAVGIMPISEAIAAGVVSTDDAILAIVGTADGDMVVYAQSRTRTLRIGADNFGFAGWVLAQADDLVATLGPGLHFGEWWGMGIQRGYGLARRCFSLFNTHRWAEVDLSGVIGLDVVPILYSGPFSEFWVHASLDLLRLGGSRAATWFMHPEGIVVFHTAANVAFKVTLEHDDVPKSLAAVSR